MDIKNETFIVNTSGFEDSIDLTDKVKNIVKSENIKNGLANVFIASSTSGLIITEDEPGIILDIKKYISSVFPVNKVYQHDMNWQEGNGYSYLRAFCFQKNVTIPIISGNIMLDKYQKIVMIDFNSAPSAKNITVTLIKDE